MARRCFYLQKRPRSTAPCRKLPWPALVFLAVLVLLCLLADVLTPGEAGYMDAAAAAQSPSAAHLLGTDALGRDVLAMLDGYRESAGPELRKELSITVADMRSGNYEAALTRLEARVGSTLLSDVTRGLIGILRGDDTSLYWSALSLKLADIQRQQLKQKAQKVPGKVKRLSMCLLGCFVMTYMSVIVWQIFTSLGVLFG